MPRTVVGLDIGSTAVRAVQVVPRGRTPQVVKSGSVPLPRGAVDGGHVRDAEEVTKALKRLWHENRFSTRRVRLGIGSGSVLVRQVELDWMPPQDLRKAMRYLVADLLPVPIDEANIDHVELEEVHRPGVGGAPEQRLVKVLLVATARDGVDETVRCVQAAGLRPVTADLSPLALVRAAATSAATGRGRGAEPDVVTEAIVDVGADKISVAVHTAGRPHFVRVIPGSGGGSLTRALAELTGAYGTTAEDLKRQLDLTAAPGQPGTAAALPGLVLREAAQRLADEIRETVRFYTESAADNPRPTRLVLTGRGAAVAGFTQLCAATLGLPASDLDAVRARRRRRSTPDDDLSVAYGLCLGATA